MSTSNNIRLLLDIQDEHIHFEENAIQIKDFKGSKAKFITGKPTYTPTHCECCGVKNENHTVFKNGTKALRITLPIAGIYPKYLYLKKQRLYCRACQSSFYAKTTIVREHCFISEDTKRKVFVQSAKTYSLTDPVQECSVSTTTVQRVTAKEAKTFKPYYRASPKHLSFDEFKHVKSRMALEYINAEPGDIIDILEGKDARTVKHHFIYNYYIFLLCI